MHCLHKHKRHLFLEENDNNATNSFIVAVNSLQGAKDYLYLLAGHTDQVLTVADNIDDVVNVSNNIPAINEANRNVPDIKSFNDNINNGAVLDFIRSFTNSMDSTANKWQVLLEEIGSSIQASADAYNYEAVLTINTYTSAGTEIILPARLRYKINSYMLLIAYNGALLYKDINYEEVGNKGEWSTVVKFKFPLQKGDQICFRTIGISSEADVAGDIWVQRIEEAGEAASASLSAFNASYMHQVRTPLNANTTFTLPNGLQYKVGSNMLLVSYNGTLEYEGDQYYEVGAANEISTEIIFNHELRVGDKLGFRVISVGDIPDIVYSINNVYSNIDTLYNTLNSLANSIEYIKAILQQNESTEEPTEPTEPTDEPTGDNTEGTGGDDSGNDNEGNGGDNTNP